VFEESPEIWQHSSLYGKAVARPKEILHLAVQDDMIVTHYTSKSTTVILGINAKNVCCF